MTTHQSDVLERVVHIAARPEIVFSFLTDPSKLIRWVGNLCSLDPTPGGIFRVELNERRIIRGRYVEVVPYSRVVFTWGLEGENSPMPPGSTRVEIALIADGDGTTLQLQHSGLPTSRPHNTGKGWDNHLARLVIVAEGGDAGSDPLTELEEKHF